MGISVQVRHLEELKRYESLIESLGNPNHKRELLESIGSIAESQTRRRISDEKTAPDGTPWQDWSAGYEKTPPRYSAPFAGGGGLVESHQVFVCRR